jgi:hypothetical protein
MLELCSKNKLFVLQKSGKVFTEEANKTVIALIALYFDDILAKFDLLPQEPTELLYFQLSFITFA